MELLIEAPQQVQEYRWNYEEIKAAAVAKAEEYKAIAYTDADEAAMKKDKADLNRIIAAIEGERKRIKKDCMKPYDRFEAQVKDVLEPLREAVESIEKGLGEIDRAYRDAKTGRMRELYASAYADIRETVPFEKTVREEYFKKAFTDKKLEKAYLEQADKVHADLQLLGSYDRKYQAAATAAYLAAFSVSDAQAEVFRLQKLDEVLEQNRMAEEQRRQAEEQRKAQWQEELARKQAAEAERQKQLAEQRERIEAEQAGASLEGQPARPEPDAEAEKTISFGPVILYGTRSQLLAMAGYLKENGIRCERWQ